MTDEELIVRWDDYVESMGSVMGEVEHMAQQMRDHIKELEAKLAKAVEALEAIAATKTLATLPWTHSVAADTYWKMIDHMKFNSRAALAEIKGESYDWLEKLEH